MIPGISAVERSGNRKIGDVSTTYSAQVTCDVTCPFLKNGCYAESSLAGITTARVNNEALEDELSYLQLARYEAAAIRELSGKRPLRLHVVGDCKSNAAAKIVSAAAREYRARFGSPVWTYTHAWRKVARTAWGDVSVLASCETTEHIRQAARLGYATAIVVSEHKSDKAYYEDGIKLIPCPQQTHKTDNCASCKLCFDDARLLAIGGTIAFAAHGATRKVKAALTQIELGG